jgi:sarcosine oxidase subunit delta
MLISCPHCGPRDEAEFTYLGAALPRSPGREAGQSFAEVYQRDNPCGAHRELWHHNFGCRGILEVDRDTLTHAISAARYVRGREG